MTKAVAGILGLAGVLMTFSACEKKEDTYSVIPEITYKGMNRAEFNVTDTALADWFLYYDFVDGDGDLGTRPDDASMRVFLVDTTNGRDYEFPFPYIPKQDRSGKKYLKGYGNIKLRIAEFFRLSSGVNRDTAVFSLYIKDERGNESNIIYTEPVIYYR